MNTVDTFLAHYGVKGMKWGVRRDRTATDVHVTAIPGRKLKATGGKHQPAHVDAIRAVGYRQQAKKSRTDSLSNKELQDAITRMNLEAQFKNLSANHVGAGRKLATGLLGSVGDREVNQLADYAVSTSGRESAGSAVRIGAGAARSLVKTGKKK